MSSHPDGQILPVEAALAAAESSDPAQVLRMLAQADIVLPQEQPPTEDGQPSAISLPVLEQDGTQYVPAFTSPAMLAELAPQVSGYAVVRGAELGAAWPSEELWLAVNPGSDLGATVPPDAVRALPALLASG